MSYFLALSRVQWAWLIGSLLAAVAILALGWSREPADDLEALPPLDTSMSIRQVAPALGTTGPGLARELGLPLRVAKNRPLAELGVSEESFREAVEHLASHRPRTLKYHVFAAISLWSLVFLVRLGKPDGAPPSAQRSWYPRFIYVATLGVAVVAAGFALGKSPNPMEGAVKLFKGMVGLQASIAAVVFGFVFFTALAVVGNKLVCGWACPFGALQELIYTLPVLKKLKRRKVPFWLSHSIRGGLFAIMLLVLFGLLGGRRGMVIYHPINPFNLFDLRFETPSILIAVVVSLVAAVFVYRPFCQFACPFGFVSWIAERASLVRVRVDRSRCNRCMACARSCPTGAAGDKVAGRVLAADCYSCMRCLNVCPSQAIEYRPVWDKLPSKPPANHATP